MIHGGTMQQFLEIIYQILGVTHTPNIGDVLGFTVTVLILVPSLASIIKALTSKKDVPASEVVDSIQELTEKVTAKAYEAEKAKAKSLSFAQRLINGLAQTRKEIWGKLENIITGNKLNDEMLEELEGLLYGADLGPKAVAELLATIQKDLKEKEIDLPLIKKFISDFLEVKMAPIQKTLDPALFQFDQSQRGKTKVIMIVGVNGAGKTTTIGKLATKLKDQGAKVVVGACDTFRAAAVDQLQVWCDRAGVEMIRAKEGSNPTGVAYDTLQAAINQKADYCLLDTAGRLHTKTNLMDELAKTKNVLRKLDPEAPHQVLLVIDAITGQNALNQAREFHQALGINGLIFTKCDGSSKAGSAVHIVSELNIPIAYIGVGEKVEDLDLFHLDQYLAALLA
jgi:fused signal recognition particle receptor